MIAPFIEEQAKLHPDNVVFVHVDMDEFGSLVNVCAHFFLFFIDIGQYIYRKKK